MKIDADWPTYFSLLLSFFALVISGLSFRKANQVESEDKSLEVSRAHIKAVDALKSSDGLYQTADQELKSLFSLAGRSVNEGNPNSKHLTEWQAEIDDAKVRLEAETTEFDKLSRKESNQLIAKFEKIEADILRAVTNFEGEIKSLRESRANLKRDRSYTSP